MCSIQHYLMMYVVGYIQHQTISNFDYMIFIIANISKIHHHLTNFTNEMEFRPVSDRRQHAQLPLFHLPAIHALRSFFRNSFKCHFSQHISYIVSIKNGHMKFQCNTICSVLSLFNTAVSSQWVGFLDFSYKFSFFCIPIRIEYTIALNNFSDIFPHFQHHQHHSYSIRCYQYV